MATDLIPRADTVTIACDPAALAEALAACAPAVPTRSPKPTLLNVLLTVDDAGRAHLSGTDLEVGVRVAVPGVTADRAARAVLPPHRLRQVLAGAVGRSPELRLTVTDTGSGPTCEITGRDVRFVWPLEDPLSYPEMPPFPEAQGWCEVAGADLRKLVRRTTYATDVESTRYALGGCLVETAADALALVATDGRRMARQSVPAVPGSVAGAARPIPEAPGTVIPVKALRLLQGVAGEDTLTALVTVTPGKAFHARTDRADVYSRLLEGRFPRYTDAVPADSLLVGTAEATASEWLWVVTQASVTTSEESRAVVFEFDRAAGTWVRSSAADRGEGTVKAAVGYEGPPVVVGFDPRYLTEFFRSFDGPDVLRLRLASGWAAARWECPADPGFMAVVMPLELAR